MTVPERTLSDLPADTQRSSDGLVSGVVLIHNAGLYLMLDRTERLARLLRRPR